MSKSDDTATAKRQATSANGKRQRRIDQLKADYYHQLAALNAEHMAERIELALKFATKRSEVHANFRTALDKLRRAT